MKMVVTKLEPSLVAPAMETPKGLHFLSNLDQNLDLDLATIVHAIYIFESEEKMSGIAVEVIKEALGKVLVHYYPLAGRLVFTSDGKQILDCTGEGALFVEAEVDCELKEIEDMTKENIPTFEKLLYKVPRAKTHMDYPPIVAQVTRFKCGGFALATSMNHCLLDGRAASEFMNSWGETARNLPLSTPPFLDRTLLKPRTPLQVSFPHHEFDDIQDISNISNIYSNRTLVHTCFVFNQQKLSHLKQEAMKDNTVKSCSTFEALSGFIWKSRTQALNLHPNQKVKLLVSVDGRTRFNPPLPKGFVGNAVFLACAICYAGELAMSPLSFAVSHVQEAVKVMKDEYMRSAIDFLENGRLRPELTATLLIAAWSRLPYLQTDFGWGAPVKTFTLGSQVKEKELCTFLSGGEEGKGIEVKLCLPASVMQVFKIVLEQNVSSL